MLVQLVDEYGVVLDGAWNFPHYLSFDGAHFEPDAACEPCGYVLFTSLRTVIPFERGCKQIKPGQPVVITVSFKD
jgi:hypothetical protein